MPNHVHSILWVHPSDPVGAIPCGRPKCGSQRAGASPAPTKTDIAVAQNRDRHQEVREVIAGRIVANKTNAMRALEARKVSYETYTFPPEIHSAIGVAEALGVPASQVYKTLVVMRKNGEPLLVLAPGDRELDLKRLAKAVGEKKLRMATHKEAESLTGLHVGAISALALLNRGFEVYIDRAATKLERVLVSAGRQGINLGIGVGDLIRVTKAKVVEAAGDTR